MGALATLLISKGLPILATALFNKIIDFKSIGNKLGIRSQSEEDLVAKIERSGLTDNQMAALVDLQYKVAVEDEVTKRLAIDSNADSWFTKHIRPIMMIFTSVSAIAYFFALSMISFDPDKIEIVKAFGNYLFMLNTGIFSFYFGGRSWEKVTEIKINPKVKKLPTTEVPRADIPVIR